MTLGLLLYWFPIFLGVAVGTSLLGGLPRPRATALAMICALFWVALVQSNLSRPVWSNTGMLLSTLAGACAIAIMGLCGSDERSATTQGSRPRGVPKAPETLAQRLSEPDEPAPGSTLAALKQFDAWLDDHRQNDDPWADFDEFIRGLIYQWTEGKHVRTFRVLDSGELLLPLRESEGEASSDGVSPRKGVIGFVATTGRSFVAGDSTQGTLIDHLLNEEKSSPHLGPERNPPVWCFAVKRRATRVGVVAIGEFDVGSRGGREEAHFVDPRRRERLRSVELLVNYFWNCLLDVERSRTAVSTDPGSGVLTRRAFFEIAGEALTETQRSGEPAAVAVLALEGVRALDDEGQWEAADDIRTLVSGMLKRRLRIEDRIGRFDDSRFILLLRRVDSELAQLIMRELMAQVSATLSTRKPHGEQVRLRSGLAGTGVCAEKSATHSTPLRNLVAAAVEACNQARRTSQSLVSDLGAPPAGSTALPPRLAAAEGAA